LSAKQWNLLIAALVATLYAGTIVFGLHVKSLSLFGYKEGDKNRFWKTPSRTSIPRGPTGDSIRRGARLFDETPVYASRYTQARVSCGSCHAQGGIQPYASPMVGLPALFPMFNKRAGHIISLQDRIEECFVRSENGTPLPYDSPEMKSLVDYITWISQPEPSRIPYVGRGLVALPALKPDAKHGAQIYAEQCAGCHGTAGDGLPPLFPPLWGPRSFNDGAGIHGIDRMAAFVQHNMPQNRMGILSAQDAFDVSAYIHAQPRPAFNPAYKNF
jgi:thiosulfate dehydrogenase